MSTPVVDAPNTEVPNSGGPSTQLKVLEQGNNDDKIVESKVQPEVKEIPEEKQEEEIETKSDSEDELNLDDEELAEEELAPEEELEALPGRINFKEVKKAFPDILKKYPQLQANYYKAEEYTEILPTIEDAKTAAAKAEVFDVINERALSGDINLILDGIEAEAPKALNKIATDILPTLYKKSPQLYSEAMAPEIKKLILSAIRAGDKNNNENLKNAALVLKQYVFGDGEMPADKVPEKVDEEKENLKKQANTMLIQQANNFENDAKEFTAKHLIKQIESDLDPDGSMSKFVKDKLVEQILEDVNVNLSKNPALKKEMSSLWQKAAQQGFSAEMKPVLARAFLARAKLILPAIKQKRRNEVFGKEVKVKNAGDPILKKTNIRQSSGNVKSNSPVVSKTEIRKEGLSPMDVIMRGA